MENQEEKQFNVALSFAGEDREYVEKVANQLKKMNIRVFYDKHEAITLWGKDLYTYLQDIYKNKAMYTIIFCSKNYANKLWTNHERQAAQARAFGSNREYILPVRFDNTEIPGILLTMGYIDLNQYKPEEFAELIKNKIGPIHRPNFFPENPDLLIKKMKIKSKKSKEEALLFAYKFFDSMKLMTREERIFFIKYVLASCPCGHPDEIHQEMQYLERKLSMKSEEIKQILARLSCVDLETSIGGITSQSTHISNKPEIITTKFEFGYKNGVKNGTKIIFPIIDVLQDCCCKTCFWECIANADFSSLSSVDGYNEQLQMSEH